MKHYKKKSGLDIYEMIANEKMSFPEIKDILSEYIENTGTVSKKTVIETTNDNDNRNSGKEKSKGDCLIIDRNLSGIEYKLAKCCNPVYGDDIFAFVTIMSGISVHRDDCQNGRRLKERYPYRILSAKWNKERSDGMFLARIGFVSDDVIGLDSSIRDLLKSLKTTLRSLNINYEKNGIVGELAVEVNSSSVLDGVIYNLKKIKGITKVYRL